MLLSLLPFSIFSFLEFVESLDTSSLTVIHWTALGLALAAAVVIQWFISFEQVIEVMENGKFSTYYRVGMLKFAQKVYWGPMQILLEQNAKRFFCVTIKTGSNESIVLEKIPTLKQANERLNEVKAAFQ